MRGREERKAREGERERERKDGIQVMNEGKDR